MSATSRKLLLTISLFILMISFSKCQDGSQPQPQVVSQILDVPQQIVMSVGQIAPGNIILQQSKQQLHYLHIDKLEKKYLFVRLSSYDKVRHSVGIYDNITREIVYACQDSIFDSCYVPVKLLKEDTVYVLLVVAMESMKYNIYTYFGDLQHLEPNSQMKFTFNKQDLTQLFHLEFQNKPFTQIRITLKPEAARSQGDSLKMFANLGFKQQPTMQKHDFVSEHIWGDAQAILLSKEQIGSEKGIGLYIVGNADTIYTLHCQFVEEDRHQIKINQTVNQYLPKNKQTSYLISLKDTQGMDTFSLKFSVFTGDVSVTFYYDKQLTKEFNKEPFQYMNDMQFYFSKNDFEGQARQIYMKVKSFDAKATYQAVFQGRNKQIAYQITENVYQFSVIKNKQALYFYAHIWSQNNFEQLQSYKFDLSMIKIFGSAKYAYYACKNDSHQDKCKDISSSEFQNSVQKLTPIGVQQIGSKTITSLQFNASKFKTINNVQKRILVIIVVENTSQNRSSVAIQFSNPNNIRLLREGRAFEDKVRTMERKYYKYINNNPTIQQIRIHINEISGLTKIRAKRQQIRQPGGTQMKLSKSTPNTLIIRQRLTQPIYIQIFGLVSSLYTISVSAVHPQHRISNSLVMAQDISYQFKLEPMKTLYLQLHPIQAAIQFQYYVQGGAVTMCQINQRDKCIDEKIVSAHGVLYLDSASSREVRVKIGNFGRRGKGEDDAYGDEEGDKLEKKLADVVRNVKLTMLYHGAGIAHCDQRRLNKVYSQTVNADQCFKFHLPLATDIQIMAGHSEIGIAYQQYKLCKRKVTPTLSPSSNRYLITTQVIKQLCQSTPNDMNLIMTIGSKNKAVRAGLKIDYSVQYNNDTVTLADGVAYIASGFSTPEVPQRTFFYEILDQDRDVNIILFNRKGIQRFYVDLIPQPQRYFGTVTENKAKFNSKSSDYYTNPYIKITSNDIKLARCGKACVIVLSVYSSQKTGTEIEYALEITQNHIEMREDQIKSYFLSKGSVEFFQYDSRKQKGSIIFKVSDNNRHCTRSIMSKSPFPTNSNYFLKQNQGTILYDKSQKGIYYFAVQAVQDCPFTVSISEREGIITKIQYGQFYDIKLEEGQQKWFYTRHISNSSMKIMFLKDHGEIQLYANATDLSKDTLKGIQDNKGQQASFSFKSSYKNTLVISSQAKQFCFNCYYLICVQATKLSQGSLFLGSDNSKITLTESKILFDQITNVDSVTAATFYKVSDGNLQVKVHSGKIKLEMSYSSQKFSKQYPEDKKVYHESYNFTREEGKYLPIDVLVTPLVVPALYSIQINPSSQDSAVLHKVNPGQHTYIFLQKNKEQCFTGAITGKQQQIFITVDSSEHFILANLNLTVKVDDKILQDYQKQIVGNILSIRIISKSQLFTKVAQYHICVKTESRNDSLSMFIFQNQNVNLIHSDTQVLIRNQSKFVLYPRSDVIVDLFQCSGKAQIYYGSNLQKIKQKQSHKLDVIGIPGQSHAIRITEFSTLYLDIIADMATVLWIPLNQKQQRGIGYFKYDIGSLQYRSKFNNIQFNIGGVYKSKETKTEVKSIRYSLFVSNDRDILQNAVMCEKNRDHGLVSVSLNTTVVGTSPQHQITLSMDKKRITDAFSVNQSLYFNVVADMVLEPPGKLQGDYHQHYRFVYFQQMVPSEVFRQNKIQEMQLTLLIIFAVVSLFGFVLVSCIFVKCIIPALGRLKNRVLVEERDDAKDQSIPIPMSSDRGEIPPVPSGTDQQLR